MNLPYTGTTANEKMHPQKNVSDGLKTHTWIQKN